MHEIMITCLTNPVMALYFGNETLHEDDLASKFQRNNCVMIQRNTKKKI